MTRIESSMFKLNSSIRGFESFMIQPALGCYRNQNLRLFDEEQL